MSQPGTVNIYERSGPGAKTEKAEAPPANQKWVVLTTEMAPPSVGALLPAKQIKLVDGVNGYEALAMAGTPGKGRPAFVYFKNPEGHIRMGASGEVLWTILKNPTTRESEIRFQKSGGERVYLLFAVPVAAKNLSLKLP